MSDYKEELAVRRRLEKMTTQELREELDRQLKKKLIKEIEKLDDYVSTLVEQHAVEILRSAVGIRSDWEGRWEVDHTNGRRSAVADELGNHAMTLVRLAIPEFVEKFVGDHKFSAKFKRAARREFKEQVSRKMYEEMREWAEKESASYAAQLLRQVTREKQED